MTNRAPRRPGPPEEVAFPVTPMLDMAFQLLAFFVLTFQTPSRETRLDLYLPAAAVALPGPARGPSRESTSATVVDVLETDLVVRAEAGAGGKLASLRLGDASLSGPEELGRKLRSVAAADLDDALESLAESGVVTREGERWSVHASHLSLVGPGLEQRLDSVRHLLGAVGEAVRARFFRPEGQTFSLPRVLSFAASREALERSFTATYAAVRERVTELDAEASTAGDAVPAQLVFVVVEAPRE